MKIIIVSIFTFLSLTLSAYAALEHNNMSKSNISMKVYKNPSCGCCDQWSDHIKENGFKFAIINSNSLGDIKKQHSIPAKVQGCHTSVTADGFVFEGHVPAKYISQFLVNPPEDAIGLAVPGMPMGSPGMEVGGRFLPYEVLLIKIDATTEIFAKVSNSKAQI